DRCQALGIDGLPDLDILHEVSRHGPARRLRHRAAETAHVRRYLGAAVELYQPSAPDRLNPLARLVDAHSGLAAHEERAHALTSGILAELLEDAREVEHVGGCADQHARMEPRHDVGPAARIHAAAWDDGHAHFDESGLDAPSEHVRPEARD